MVVDLAALAARAAETPQEEATPGPVPFDAAAAAVRASGPAIHPRQREQAASVDAADVDPPARMVAGPEQERWVQRMDPPAAYSTDAHLVLDSSAINLLEDTPLPSSHSHPPLTAR